MFASDRVRTTLLFVSAYLLLAVPPYLALNRDVVREILERSFPPSPVAVATLGVGAVVILVTLLGASEGVDRYTQFLAAPTDWLSVLVGLSFPLAAMSWWAVPELALEYVGRVDLGVLYVLVFAAHVPMLLFLSLLTAVGFAQRGAETR